MFCGCCNRIRVASAIGFVGSLYGAYYSAKEVVAASTKAAECFTNRAQFINSEMAKYNVALNGLGLSMSDIYQAGANWLKNGGSSQAIEAVPNKFANSGLESFFKERAPDVADMMNIAGASINDLHTMGTQVFHKIENEGVSALVQLGNDPAFYDLERQMKVFMTPEKAENLKNLENNFFSVLSNDDCSPIKDYAETMNFLMTAFLVGAAVSLTAFFVGPWLIKKASKCRMPSCFKRTPPPIANNIPPVSRQQFLINRSADKPRRSQPQELPLGQRNNPIDHEQEKVRRQSLENEWAKRQRAVINGKVN